MTDRNPKLDVAQIALKCRALGFPVEYDSSESGPRVRTHYFTQALGASAPLSKVMGKKEDIAFACGVDSVMITRVRDKIAFAIPLTEPEIIQFDKALHWMATTPELREMPIPILMGQTPTGEWLATDLTTQPHLLIGGSSGQGKSVFISEVISGLVVMKEPSELELLVIDTKKVDLTLFETLPHVTSTVTDLPDIHNLLDSLISLVDSRTSAMRSIARNIREYNALCYNEANKMPHKLLIIDELANVLEKDREIYGNTAKQRDELPFIESKLKTLTQISRAAGIHVIAATQRPSSKSFSGDIKVNFPMRISFKFPTGVDSRVVLGEEGAENLLGQGDYLYQTVQNADTRRAHGAFVRTEDIARICTQHEFIRKSLRGMVTT